MKYNVVVSRYNEVINLLNIFDPKTVIVYNKGSNLSNYPMNVVIMEEKMENKGLESSSYLKYIIDYYDNLPDIVFFTQGRIDDHLIETSRHAIFSKYIHVDKFSKTSRPLCLDAGFENNHLRYWNGELADAGMDVIDFFNKYVNVNNDEIDLFNNFHIFFTAIFSVSRDLIRSRPKEYYERLYNMEALNYQRPEVAHFFERSWFYIFNCHKA
jgi:hypothetical protein